jgi:hypothetical protein
MWLLVRLRETMEKLPNVGCKRVNTRKITREGNVGDGDAPNTDETLSPRDKFRVKSFIPIMDALETSLKRIIIIYKNYANNFSFLVDLDTSEEQQNVSLLMKDYPENIDINLAWETHSHACIRDNYRDAAKRHQHHQDINQIIIKDKIQLAFPFVEIILQLFLSLMVANCSGERSFLPLNP